MNTVFTFIGSVLKPDARRTAAFLTVVLLTTFSPCQHLFAQGLTLEWAKGTLTNATGQCWPEAMKVDASGNVYLTGNFYGTIDFDPNVGVMNLTGVSGSLDIFFAKYNSSGALVYAHRIGDLGSDHGTGIAVDAASNVYITGQFNGTADFDPGVATYNLTSTGGEDTYLAKYDVSGNWLYSERIGGTNPVIGLGIALDAANNVHLTGIFLGTADFDPGAGVQNLTSAGDRDIFLAKYNGATGVYLYAKRMGGAGEDYGWAIAVDGNNCAYITGFFNGTADLDPGPGTQNLTSSGDLDVFFAKYNAVGDMVYAKSIGGIDREEADAIAVDGAGQVYLTGFFDGTADMDPGAGATLLTVHSTRDLFLAKYDANGNLLYADGIGGSGETYGEDVVVDGAGNACITGGFAHTTDFDPGPGTLNLSVNNGFDQDFYIAEYDPNGALVSANVFGSANNEEGRAIALGIDGSIHVAGHFRGTATAPDFDPGAGTVALATGGYRDGFWAKYSRCTIGGPCNDGNPGTTNDVFNSQCVCVGTPPCHNLTLTLEFDLNSIQTSWDVRRVSDNAIVASHPFYLALPGTSVTETFCLLDDCYFLEVFDAAGNGMTNGFPGGYVLRDENGNRIIDNKGNGSFGALSRVQGCGVPLSFCLPMGTNSLDAASCDREDWCPSNCIVANEDPAVTATFGIHPADGYQFWIFDPNGTYSRRMIHPHSNSTMGCSYPYNGLYARRINLGLFATTSGCVPPIPCDKLLNVRVRTKVNGVYSAWGPACRFKIRCDGCRTTKLNSTWCGKTNVNPVHDCFVATPVSNCAGVPANRYQYYFACPAQGYTRNLTKPSYIACLNFSTQPIPTCADCTVKIRMSFDNGLHYCPWGPICDFGTHIPGCFTGGGGDHSMEGGDALIEQATPKLHVWPNPNNGDQLFISIDDLGEEVSTASIDIMDVFGKRVMSEQVPMDGSALNTVFDLKNELADGLYMVNITAGPRTFTQRLVIAR